MIVQLWFVLVTVSLVCACAGHVQVDVVEGGVQHTSTTDVVDSQESSPETTSSGEGRTAEEAVDTPAGVDAVGTCETAVPLSCGDSLSGNTLVDGRPNEWSGYSCTARLESGPEVLYSFTADADCQVTVRLKNLAVDLDLLVLNDCDPWSCIKAASTPLDIQDIEEMMFDAQAGVEYFIVVDGYAGASGTYDIEVECPGGSQELSLTDGNWEMHVDRKWKGSPGDVQFPTDPLFEDDYEPVEDGPVYKVVVSAEGKSVEVGDEPLVGTLMPGNVGELMFELAEGTFAGGRFVVWASSSALQAELTMYGSGVPIVKSERGKLVKTE